MAGVRIVAAGILAALAGAAPPTAAEGFRAIQEACKGDDAARIEKLLPAAAAEGVAAKGAEGVAAWRKEYAALLAKATLAEAREAKDEAVTRCTGADKSEVEVVLKRAGDAWVVASPLAYLVMGKTLDGANGRGPAGVRLSARTVNGPYGPSGFSFAHVTADAAKCAGRIDLWYCHNGDLHAAGGGLLGRVRAKDLTSAAGIPEGASWNTMLAPEAGGIYVMRCRRKGHHDFYVKFKAVAVEEKKCDLQWALLASGQGSPGSIHAPQPVAAGEPADAFDGSCAKNRDRSKPEPVPPEPGTSTPK